MIGSTVGSNAGPRIPALLPAPGPDGPKPVDRSGEPVREGAWSALTRALEQARRPEPGAPRRPEVKLLVAPGRAWLVDDGA